MLLSITKVCERVNTELSGGAYDAVVFTYDYLERSNGEEKGVFPLDDTPWSDPKKPVALVPYASYLTIQAAGLGCDIARQIRGAHPEVTNARAAWGTVRGTPALYFSKQVDDAFDDGRETSSRTLDEPWLESNSSPERTQGDRRTAPPPLLL